MSGGSKSSEPVQPPSSGENYESFIKAYSNYAPQREAAERSDIETQLALTQQYTPEILNLYRQYIPDYVQLEKDLGPGISDLQKQQLEQQIGIMGELAPSMRSAFEDPQTQAIRNMLGQQIEQELSYGAKLDPGLQREIEQSVRAAQSARGMSRGTGAIASESLIKGLQAEQLRQQRQQAANQFLQTQAATQFDPWAALTGTSGVRQTEPYQQQITTPQNYSGVGQILPSAMGQDAQTNLAYSQGLTTYNNLPSSGGASFAGGLSGAMMGAKLGSAVPGVGTAIGAIGGGLLGMFAGGS